MANPFLESSRQSSVVQMNQRQDNPFLDANLPTNDGPAMVHALQVAPDQYAKAQRISKDAGLPADVLARNPQQAARAEFQAKMQSVRARNPQLADWLTQEPRRLALAQDDVDALDYLGTVLAQPLATVNPLARGIAQTLLQRAVQGPVEGVQRSEIGETFQREAAATGASAWHAVTDFIDQTVQRPVRDVFGALEQAAESAGDESAQGLRVVGEAAADPLGAAGQARESAGVVAEIGADRQAQAERIGGRPTAELLRSDPSAWLEQATAYYTNLGTASLPAMMLAVATRRPGVGGGVMGVTSGSATYGELRGDGIDRMTAAGAALGSGAAEAGLGAVGLSAAMRPGLRSWLTAPATEAWTEGLTTASQIEIEDFARGERTGAADKLWQVFDATVLGAGFGLAERGGSGALNALVDYPQRRAEMALEEGERIMASAAGAAQLQALTEAAAQAKLGERSPDDLRAFVREAGGDGNVYIDAAQAQTLFQSAPELLAEVVGGPEALAEQVAAGDVVIPVDQFLARVARLPNAAEIQRHARMQADHLSPAEVERLDLDGMVEQLAGRDTADAPDAAADASQAVQDDVFGQLIATGRYTPAAAEDQAKLWAAAFSRFGQMAGVDPHELYQRYMGGIRSAQADGSVPATARRPWMGDGRLDALIDAARSPDRAAQGSRSGPSLTAWLQAQGGVIDDGGELRGMDAGRQRVGLINSAGMPLDRAREIAAEAGYLSHDSTVADFIDLIDQDLRQGNVYSVQEGNRAREAFNLELQQLLEAIDNTPALADLTQEEFRALTNQQIAEALFGSTMDQAALNFDQPAGMVFDESAYRPAVVAWARERYGDAVAPNGNPAWQNFVAWFGDSQAVDRTGAPVEVFHGSPDARFMDGDATFMSMNDRFGAKQGVGAFWFAADRATANSYADDSRAFDYQNAEPRVIPAFLRLENPLIVDGGGKEWREAQAIGKTTDVIEKAQAEGHDGVIIRNVRDNYNNNARTKPTDTYVVFNSRQIKSSQSNSGAFDPANPSILNQPGIDQTQTPEFRNWFGESKVVDGEGKPLVVYHGSRSKFDTFDVTKAGENGAAEGYGFYFTDDESTARGYMPPGGSLTAAFLRMERPMPFDQRTFSIAQLRKIIGLIVDAEVSEGEIDDYRDSFLSNFVDTYSNSRERAIDAVAQQIREGNERAVDAIAELANVSGDKAAVFQAVTDVTGFDGVVSNGYGNNGQGGGTIYVAWNPTQIKSATANRGTFDPNDPSILNQSAAPGVDEATGLPLNSDGTVTVYHHTSAANAEAIRRTGVLRSAGEPAVYVTTTADPSTGYGDTAVPIRIHPSRLQLDDEFPDGRVDYSISVGRPGGQVRVTVEAQPQGEAPAPDRTLFQRMADGVRNLFSQQPSKDGPRGQIQIFPDRRMAISLFETADRSTFLHESAHFFFEVYGDIAGMADADPQAKADFDRLLQWGEIAGDTAEARLATWQAMDPQARVDLHEKVARGFEAYLFEGRAPSPDLRGAFAAFSAWLRSIYRAIRNLNVDINDDIRGVFDRMLATDEEIEAAQVRQGYEPLPLDGLASQIGLTEKQLATYHDMLAAATEEARAEVTANLMAAHDRAAKRWYKEETARVRAEVEAEFEAQPVFRAARILSGGQTLSDGSPVPENLRGLKLSKDALVEVYGDAYLQRLRRLYAVEGGVDQDSAAMLLGFPSGDALVTALANRGDLRARVDAETTARMRERHGDPMTDGTLAERAMDAVHNNARVKVLQRELDMLADVAGRERLPLRAIAEMARRQVSTKTLRSLRPNDYLAAERKSAREATNAAAKGDYAAALLAKRRQAFNAAMYRATRDAQKRAESTTRYLRRAASDKTRKRIGQQAGKFYVDALDAIFAGVEVGQASGREVARRASLRDWVRKMQEDGNSTAVPESLLARVESERVTNLADMTVAEVQGLREAVENLLHLARVKNRLLTAKGEREWEDMKAEMVERLQQAAIKHGRGGISDADRKLFARIGDLYAAGSNWVLQPETLIEWLDGGTTGPFHDALWDVAQAAERKREALNRLVGDKLQEALGALPAAERKLLDRRWRIESMDADVSGHSILSALLNMGNEGNRDKLTRGGRVVGDTIVPFTPEQLHEMFGKLTKAQAEAVQGIWDAFDLLWPEIVALEESMNGIAPERVVATPFTVETRDGPVALRGGYYHVMYDPKGAQAGQFNEDEQAKRVLSGQTPIRASTSKGHTEKRTDFVAPLLLDYHSVITRHLDGVIGDIAHRQFLRQVYKVLGDADIRRMIDNRVGPGAAIGLRKGFERGATGNFSLAGPLFGPFQKVADGTMTNLSSAALGFRIPLALANVVAVPIQAAIRVKPRYVLSGLRDYYLSGGLNIIGNMRRNAEMVQRMSPLMLRRAEARSVELSSIIANLRGKRGFRAKMIEMAMSIHQWTVPLAENAAWMGAYQQAMAGGASMSDAIVAADKAIRQTQTKTSAMELSQGEGGYMRMFMQFAGPLVIMNNRLQEAGMRGLRGDVKSWPQALGVWFAVAMGAAWSFEIMMGRGPEGDDEEPDAGDWAWWAAKKLALLPFAAFPLLRDVASFADSGFSRGTPLAEAGKTLYEATFGTAESLFADDEVDVERLVRTQVRAAGVAVGVPSNQLLRTGEYLMAVSTGEHEMGNPAAEAYYLTQGAPDDD